MAIIVSPHRFRTRAQLWQYAGLGVVMRSSSDWVQGDDGKWRKDQVQSDPRADSPSQSRAQGDLHCGRLRRSSWTSLYFAKPRTARFKGAATTVIGQAHMDCPLHRHYERMLENKTKPNLAKLTLARQIAAITLSIWKKEVAFDAAKLTKPS